MHGLSWHSQEKILIMNILINFILFVYCVSAYLFLACIYHMIDALAYILWYTLQFVNHRWENIVKLEEKYFGKDN